MNKGLLAINPHKSSELIEIMKDKLDKNMEFIHFVLSFCQSWLKPHAQSG